jgi:hypothetical protein
VVILSSELERLEFLGAFQKSRTKVVTEDVHVRFGRGKRMKSSFAHPASPGLTVESVG